MNIDKRSGRRFGPPTTKRLIAFLDDMNLPYVETYGTQNAIALLTQIVGYGTFFDRVDLGFRKEVNEATHKRYNSAKVDLFSPTSDTNQHDVCCIVLVRETWRLCVCSSGANIVSEWMFCSGTSPPSGLIKYLYGVQWELLGVVEQCREQLESGSGTTPLPPVIVLLALRRVPYFALHCPDCGCAVPFGHEPDGWFVRDL